MKPVATKLLSYYIQITWLLTSLKLILQVSRQS